MAKYKYREGSYAYEEPIGFESIRSMIDDEFSSNKKTDEQQSEEIASGQAADEQFEERVSALEQASMDITETKEALEEFTGTTYPADKEALDAKDAELEAALAEKVDASEVESIAKDAAAEEVAKVVAEAPEDLDTLKEIADYIEADKTGAAEIETKLSNHDEAISSLTEADAALEAKDAELEAKDAELEAAINAIVVPEVSGYATVEQVEAVDAKVDAVDAKVDAIVIPDVSGFAEATAVTAEIAAAVEPLETAIEAKADNDSLNAEVTRAMNKESELNDAIAEKASNADLTAEVDRAVAAEEALAAKDAEQDEEIAKKVEWVESTPGRTHIVMKNHDSLLGTATNGETYNVAMVSKWDVADFGSAQLHANLNTVDAVTINDNKIVATEDVVDGKIATAVEPLATKEGVDEAIAAIEIPSIEGLAEASAVTAEIAAAVEPLATKAEVEAVDAKVDAIVIPDVSGFAEASAVTAEIAAAVEPLATKAEVETVDAKVDAIVVPDVSGLAVKTEVTEEINAEAAARADGDAALQSAIDAIVVPSIDGLASEDYVDEQIEKVVGTAPENFDTLEEFAAALADLKVVDVPAVEGEHYTQEEIDAAQEGDDAYGKTTDDWKVEPVEEVSHNMTIGEFVTTMMASVDEKPQIAAIEEKMNAMENTLKRVDPAAYQTMLNDLEVLDTLKEVNTVTISDGTIADIVIPETTKSKTITGELDPDSTLTLNSRYGVTINNTGTGSTNLDVTAPAVEGYNAATITLNSGEYDTITVTNASLTVNTGASLQNVVITEDTTKTTTINANFAEGATVTSNSDAPITLTSKNANGEEVSVVLDAPGSTVTMSGGKWVNVNAAVSPDTLIINGSVHIDNLNVTQGNVLVKVARQADIANVVANYTLAEGCSIDYLHDEINASNVSNLATTGTHTLVEDITKSGRFAPGMFASDNMVWNLNGHNITFTNTQGYANFLLRGSLQLEINGEGNVVNSAGDYGFWAAAEGVKVVVNGGHFEAATHVLYAEKGTIEVNGGSFKLTNPDECEKDANGNFKFLLNCLDSAYTAGKAKIIVRGGKFYGFNPAVTYGEPSGPVSYVAPGYHVVESVEDGMKVFEVVAD